MVAFGLLKPEQNYGGMIRGNMQPQVFVNVPVLFQGLGEDSWLVGNTVRMPFDWLQEPTTGATAAETGGEWATPILSKMPFWFSGL